ncbi:MAG: hypothetical protein K8H86_07725 [Ignavibacteriaceae bacterium]|nr:hypothetical protein [Ignavibacteriaceae bacterium]
MFGFVNSEKEKRTLGGEIHQERVKRRKIYLTILGVLGLIIVNIIFYLMTRV